MLVNFAMVWVGQKYGPEYVHTLVDMITRNASKLDSAVFWCVTDRPNELPEYVRPVPVPNDLPGWWAKVGLFSPAMPWAEGERVAYFDLDLAITGRLEDLVETKGIIRDWLWPCFNSSVMVWDHGEHRDIWDKFDQSVMTSPGKVVPTECLPAGQVNGGDQEWITQVDQEASGAPWRLFPSHWCLNYREHAQAWPPDGCKVVSFNGLPKPTEITEGWVPQVWRVGGYTSLPVMDGVNVTHEQLWENVEVNSKRDLPWFTGADAHNGTAVLVGGGPSMKDCLQQIKDHKRRGAKIVTVNNAWRTLIEAGIKPDTHVMLDARPDNVSFVEGAPKGVRYLLASQCHPDLFEALSDREVMVWHNGIGDCSELHELLAPYWETKPIRLIPGGGTVGLRTLFLIAYSGYRKIHCYGFDSSYEGDQHHAYPQALNDADDVREVALKAEDGSVKLYRAAGWMIRQAEEWKWHKRDLDREGVRMWVHGRGLLPDIAKALREEELAA